jgi:hypothetical protein
MKHSKFDILADINLKLIQEEGNWFVYYRFINENGEELDDHHSDIQSKELVEYMHEKCDLITYPSDGGDICRITKNGFDILEKGGWLKQLENQAMLQSDIIKKENKKQELKDTIDDLTIVNLEYQNSKIDLENQIQLLTRDNLRLSNWDIRFRWLIAIGSFIIGLIFSYFISV